MAGNEDRGGVSEIIKLINSTKIPIICIANEVPRKLLALKGNQLERLPPPSLG